LTAAQCKKHGVCNTQAAASCKQKGAAGAEVVTADLSGPKGVDALASAAQKLGTVDVLVNNAGAYAPMSFDQGDNKGQGPLDGMLPHTSC